MLYPTELRAQTAKTWQGAASWPEDPLPLHTCKLYLRTFAKGKTRFGPPMDPTVGLGVSLGALRAQFKVKD
jgi:hypothetical protein